MGKNKGTRGERELFHMFWGAGFAAVRLPGSGLSKYPNPDLVVGNKQKKYAIECKCTGDSKEYISKEGIIQLLTFSELFGADPFLAVRFDNHGWFFFHPNELERSKNGNYNISLEDAQKRGRKFDDLKV